MGGYRLPYLFDRRGDRLRSDRNWCDDRLDAAVVTRMWLVLRQQQRNYEATLRIAQRNLRIAEDELKRDEALVRKGTISARERDRMRQGRNEMEQGVQTSQNNLRLIGPQIEKTQAAIPGKEVQEIELILFCYKGKYKEIPGDVKGLVRKAGFD